MSSCEIWLNHLIDCSTVFCVVLCNNFSIFFFFPSISCGFGSFCISKGFWYWICYWWVNKTFLQKKRPLALYGHCGSQLCDWEPFIFFGPSWQVKPSYFSKANFIKGRFSKAEYVFSPLLCFLGLWKKQLRCLWFMPLLIMLWWFEVVWRRGRVSSFTLAQEVWAKQLLPSPWAWAAVFLLL